MNALGVEADGDLRPEVEAADPAAKEPEAPQEEPAAKPADQDVTTGEVSGDGAIGAITGGTVNQETTNVGGHQFNFRIGDSEAADDLRTLFGSASNQESPEVEVEDLLPVPDAEAHFEALAEARLLVLASTRRTGLTTAVKQRCQAFAAREELPAKRLLATSIDELGKELKGIATPTVLVLDASQNPELQRALPQYADKLRDRLEKQSCSLVLAVEIEFRLGFKQPFPDSVFDLERLQPDLVFARHFTRSHDEFPEVLGSDYFSDTLGTAWPPLARLMAEVLDHAPAGITTDEFRERLATRLGNPSETIRNLLEQRLDARGKTVLIAAAALEHLSADSIALAADALFDATRNDDEPRELLDEPGITQKLELIREDFNVEGTTFKNPDIGDEVLLHVWNQYPAWRGPVMEWLNDLLLAPDYVEWTGLTRLPRRLLQLAAAAEDERMLKEHAVLMLSSRSPVIWSFAPVIMLGGALDPVIGPGIRNRLYDWSRSENTALQWTALAACSDEDYLIRFPSNALFRLRQLSGSESDDIAEAAFEAIVDSTGHLHFAELLAHFHFWLIGSGRDETAKIAEILDRICDKTEVLERLSGEPWRLVDEAAGIAESFWRLLLQLADPASARLAIRAWLSTAAVIAPYAGQAMVAMVLRSAADDYAAIGQVAQAAKSIALDGSDLPERTRRLARDMFNRILENEVPLS